MGFTAINIGAAANDGTGDNPREMATKCNAMFEELYAAFYSTLPSAPTVGNAITTGPTTATLAFGVPSSDGGSAITGYRVTPYINGVAMTPIFFGALSSPLTLTGLTASTLYTFSIAAINARGTGAESGFSNSITTDAASTGAAVTVSSVLSSPTNVGPIPVTIEFTQSVIGFVVGDITVVNGTASGFAGSGTSFSVNIIPSGQGLVTVSVPAGVAQSNGVNNQASNTLQITYDSVAPTVGVGAFSVQSEILNSTTFRVTFSEPVTGVDASDFLGVFSGAMSAAGLITVTPFSSSAYDVTIPHAGTSGSVQACLNETGHGITDLTGNAFAPIGPTYSAARSFGGAVQNNNRYWGHSTSPSITTSAGVLALATAGGGSGTDAPVPAGGATDNDITITVTPSPEGYVYYSFPARYGPAPNLIYNGFPDNAAWLELSEVMVTPSGGIAESYRLYRLISTADQAATLIIS